MPSISKSTTPADVDDWSDEDEEDQCQDESDVETNVLLGIPSGAIDNETNERDAAVSRIGGLPALLPKKEPSFVSSHCKACNQPMELLLQIWCPFEDSPMDRALYVWGCSRAGCQGKEGSVRAFRGLRFNAPYAAKLEKKKARALARKEEEKKKRQHDLAEAKRKEDERKKAGNPFSMGGNTGSQPFGGGFGLGAQIFGGAPAPLVVETPMPAEPKEELEAEDGQDDDEDNEGSDSDESLIIAMESTAVSESPWRQAPFYPAVYIDTIAEELPYERKPALPKGVKVDDGLDDPKGGNDDMSWAKELYEDSLEVDKVFERFATRVKAEPNQCLRYDLKGVPLPFSSTDSVFEKLWPAPVAEPLPAAKPDFKVVHPQRRVYDKTAAGKCERCGAARVFECQLMPNLINVVRKGDRDASAKMTDDIRRKLVEQVLKKDGTEKTGMTWGTAMVFSCGEDCLGEDGWSESCTVVQWDE